jgi:3-methyladenine DNA glycosylase/8-oxoguanine DNA glycosylase
LAGDFSLRADQSLEQFRKEFSAVKGIGEWTVQYVAMRGLGIVDSFPAKDLGIIKALTVEGQKPKEKEILKRAEDWSPYRAYAALCLWRLNTME